MEQDEPIASDHGRPVAFALVRFPKKLRPAGGELVQKVRFGADLVVSRTEQARPVAGDGAGGRGLEPPWDVTLSDVSAARSIVGRAETSSAITNRGPKCMPRNIPRRRQVRFGVAAGGKRQTVRKVCSEPLGSVVLWWQSARAGDISIPRYRIADLSVVARP